MKLRRRILKYFLVLILLTSVVNLSISYYLTQNSGDRIKEVIHSAYLAHVTEQLIAGYEQLGSLTGIDEAALRPSEITIPTPRRWAWLGNNRITIPMASAGGWDVVVADAQGRIVIGSARESIQGQAGKTLMSQGKAIGTLWLIPRSSGIWELIRSYVFLPLLFRNFLTVLISSTLALGAAFIFSDYLARHIGELAQAARNLANGQLSYRVKVGAKDELGQLADDFNAMAEKLQENQRLRRQLQADVVHELRTPLAVVQAVLDSLDSGVTKWDTKTLTSLQEETNRMNRLLSDLHELNRADNQQLPLYKELFSVGDLLERLTDSFAELARQKEIRFSVQVAERESGLILYADLDRIIQVFLNILHNALRHTPSGGEITLQTQLGTKNTIVFSVTDTGEGIADEALPHIFDRFYSGDKSRSRSRSGTGLGLAIAKEYILLHGGSIAASSTRYHGAEFTVTLPVEYGVDCSPEPLG